MTWNTQNQIVIKANGGEAMCDITSCVDLVRLQDYLLSHMYANAARDDLWSKLTQVSSTCGAGRLRGSQISHSCCLSHTERSRFNLISAGKVLLPWR